VKIIEPVMRGKGEKISTTTKNNGTRK